MTGAEIIKVVKGNCKEKKDSLKSWTGLQMITDLYSLRYSNSIAERQIPKSRISDYQDIIRYAEKLTPSNKLEDYICKLAAIMKCFFNPAPCVDFTIDMETGDILSNE